MLRLIAFFALALILAQILGQLPIVGPFFAHTGIFGVWIAALGLSYLATRYGERAVRSRRDRSELRRLLAVDNAHNHGKAGAMLLARGRASAALPHLERAAAGEPASAEWQYRLGIAQLALRRPAEARAALERCVALNPEYAYGAAQLRLAEALTAAGLAADALPVLDLAERNHGPSPELAYTRGRALKSLGRRADAKQCFAEVKQLAAQAPQFQKGTARGFALRAFFAGLF
jgi:tetratricopeptide (TPR) repeat protein